MLRLKFFKADTKTFFRDQICRDRYRYSQKNVKSLVTKKSRYEMSHPAKKVVLCNPSDFDSPRTPFQSKQHLKSASYHVQNKNLGSNDWFSPSSFFNDPQLSYLGCYHQKEFLFYPARTTHELIAGSVRAFLIVTRSAVAGGST